MKFLFEPSQHDSKEKIGVLLVNLGTPAAPDSASIRRFLREFLSDHRVIEIPKIIWQLILNLFILTLRPRKLVPLYRSIWTEEGSPLVAIAKKQQQRLQEYFKSEANDDVIFSLAMRYGEPDIASAIRYFAQNNARKVLVFPTYPQYSATTTASIFDAVTNELQHWRWVPELRFINQYHDKPEYIEALAQSVRQHWQVNGKAQLLMMSFHGLPKRNLELGDPYFCQCHKTARLLAEKLGLKESEYQLTFQSRFGKAEWLKPYTSDTLEKLAKSGVESVDVICPGFSIDCLETLEEISVENKEVFLNAGGKQYHYIPALNESDDHIKAFKSIIEQHTQGWNLQNEPQHISVKQSAFEKVSKDLAY